MNGCTSFVIAIGIIIIIFGFMGYTIFGLPALPVGIVIALGAFVIGWFFSPERAGH